MRQVSRRSGYSRGKAAEGPPFSLTTKSDSKVGRIEVRGDLDIATADAFVKALHAMPAEYAVLVVDLSNLRFLDSSGLRALLDARRSVVASGGRLVIIDGPPQVSRVFQVTRLDKHFEIRSRLDEDALKADG